MAKCECGCGRETTVYRGKSRRYISGHHNRGKKKPAEAERKRIESRKGYKHSDETKRKISLALKGRKIPRESVQKQAESLKNYYKTHSISEETRQKRSAAQKGKTTSEETKRKMSESSKNYFKTHSISEETRQKISKIHKGKKVSEETRQKISQAHKGKEISIETRKKLSEAHKGKKYSEERKNKMSENMKGKYDGENHPQWKGGISFEPYCPKFNKAFKNKIREMFNHECFICGKHKKDNGVNLSVHHVNYDKSCLCDDVACKFVPLCSSCHMKTNHNRDYWEKIILNKLEKYTN